MNTNAICIGIALSGAVIAVQLLSMYMAVTGRRDIGLELFMIGTSIWMFNMLVMPYFQSKEPA